VRAEHPGNNGTRAFVLGTLVCRRLYHDLVQMYKRKMPRRTTRTARKRAAPPAGERAAALGGIRGEISAILAVRDAERRAVPPSAASLKRRADIIAAAIQVIARDGIRGCTITALERETGFARGHFSYHFKSKEEIIGLAFATVGSDWATTQIKAAVGERAADRLEGHVRAAVAWVLRRPDYFRCLMSFRVEMMRNPQAFPPAASIRKQMWEACAGMIRQGTAEGDFGPRTDPDLEARALFGTVDGMLMYAAMDATFCPADELADRVWRTVADRLTAST